jgi:hypothetical protein
MMGETGIESGVVRAFRLGIHSRGLTSKGFYFGTGRTKNILERTFFILLEVCGFAEWTGKPATRDIVVSFPCTTSAFLLTHSDDLGRQPDATVFIIILTMLTHYPFISHRTV